MQSYAACADPVIQAHVRASYRGLVEVVRRLSGARAAGAVAVLRHGMLLNVVASLDLEASPSGGVGGEWSEPLELIRGRMGSSRPRAGLRAFRDPG